jgi:hypothetical protein
MRKTIVINLLGGPGVGKTVLAAALFAHMKMQGVNVEQVQEEVKGLIYENRRPQAFDQLYYLGVQSRKESQFYNKVDFIVTDAPLLLFPFYESYEALGNTTMDAVIGFQSLALKNDIRHVNFHLSSLDNYSTNGRFQNHAEAQNTQNRLRAWLGQNHISAIDLPKDLVSRIEMVMKSIQELKVKAA